MNSETMRMVMVVLATMFVVSNFRTTGLVKMISG